MGSSNLTVVNSWQRNGFACEEDATKSFQINSLPQVVFLSILSYLDLKDLGRASRVSKYWYNSSLDPCLWRILKLQKRQQVTDEVLVRIASIGKNATLLDVSECTKITEAGIIKSIRRCPLLADLSAVRCSAMTDGCLAWLGRTCKNLKVLDVSLCPVTNWGVQKVCIGLLALFKRLQS